MVQIINLEPKRNIGGTLGAALGKGLGAGIEQGIGLKLQNMLQQKKEAANIPKTLGNLYKQYDKNNVIGEDKRRELEKGARSLVDQGYSADEAVYLTYENFLKSLQQEASQPEETSSLFSASKEDKQALKDIGIGALKGLRPLTEPSAMNIASPAYFANLLTQLFSKPKQEPQLFDTAGLSETEKFDIATRGLGRPEGVIEEIVSGYPFGAPGIAGKYFEQTAKAAGLPPSLQKAAEFIGFLAGEKIPSPKLKAQKSIVSKAQDIAAKTGTAAEEVLAEAQAKSGADYEKVMAGDAKEINKLKNAITEPPKVAEKVTATPKEFFNKKQAIKEREVFGSRLAESPLELYYAEEKPVEHRAETIAKKQEIIDRLTPIQDQKFEQLKFQREDLIKLEDASKTATGQEKARIESSTIFKRRQIAETLEEIKDLQYEMKHGRKRPTEAEMDAQVEKSKQAIIEEAKNPTEKGQKQVERDLELDQQYLERAEKLIERGELPGEIRPDTFLKIQKKYLDGYTEAVNALKEEVRGLKGDKSTKSIKRQKEIKQALQVFENRLKRLKANIVNQTDKLKAIQALEKPSGAFYKQQIKQAKQNIKDFQKDFFRHVQRVKTPEQVKTSKVGEKAVAETGAEFEKARKLGEEAVKNPSKENIDKITQETGKPGEKFMDDVKSINDTMFEKGEKIKKGTLKEKDISPVAKWLKRITAGYGIGYGAGLLSGVLQALSEEYLGFKPNLRLISNIFNVGSYAAYGAGPQAYKSVRNWFEQAEANQLRKFRNNPIAFNNYKKKLDEKYPKDKVNRIIKKYKELD